MEECRVETEDRFILMLQAKRTKGPNVWAEGMRGQRGGPLGEPGSQRALQQEVYCTPLKRGLAQLSEACWLQCPRFSHCSYSKPQVDQLPQLLRGKPRLQNILA